MTHFYVQPRDKSNTFIIITIKNITWGRSNEFRILFLKSTKLFEFGRVGSKLFHSMLVEGKKEFLKKLCLISKQGMLSTFRVAYDIEDFFVILLLFLIVRKTLKTFQKTSCFHHVK